MDALANPYVAVGLFLILAGSALRMLAFLVHWLAEAETAYFWAILEGKENVTLSPAVAARWYVRRGLGRWLNRRAARLRKWEARLQALCLNPGVKRWQARTAAGLLAIVWPAARTLEKWSIRSYGNQ